MVASKACCNVKCWKTTALNNAIALDISITGIVGFFFIDPNKTITGGNKTNKFQLNILFNVSNIIVTFSGVTAFPEEMLNPINVYTIEAKINAGPVVQTICPICSYKVVPAAIGAKFVVSDNGDILSPKYAPETTAPATTGNGAPIPAATPISTTPTVPADPHEVPVQIETNAVTRKDVIIINLGLIIFNP